MLYTSELVYEITFQQLCHSRHPYLLSLGSLAQRYKFGVSSEYQMCYTGQVLLLLLLLAKLYVVWTQVFKY